MPCASKLPPHSPASDSFKLMWTQAAAAGDDSLIPGVRPLCWGPRLCEQTDRYQTGEKRVGTLWVRSGFWALWKDLSNPFRPEGVSHVLHRSWVFCQPVWIMSSSISPIGVHTQDIRLMFWFIAALNSTKNYPPKCWIFHSLQTRGTGSQPITLEKPGNR